MSDNEQNLIETALIEATGRAVASYVDGKSFSASELPEIIKTVYGALAGIVGTIAPQSASGIEASPPAQKPAVNPQESVFPDYIISLEDGSQHTMLKRHLQVAHGLTPDAYRAKWGLPKTYPMTAPNYSERRSQLARESGLGLPPAARKRQTTKTNSKTNSKTTSGSPRGRRSSNGTSASAAR